MTVTSRVSSVLVVVLLAVGVLVAGPAATPARALSGDATDPVAASPAVTQTQTQTQTQTEAPVVAPQAQMQPPAASEPRAVPSTVSTNAAAKPRSTVRARAVQRPHRIVRAGVPRPAPPRTAYVVASRLDRAPVPLFLGVGF